VTVPNSSVTVRVAGGELSGPVAEQPVSSPGSGQGGEELPAGRVGDGWWRGEQRGHPVLLLTERAG
jgi:hypothetical protein